MDHHPDLTSPYPDRTADGHPLGYQVTDPETGEPIGDPHPEEETATQLASVLTAAGNCTYRVVAVRLRPAAAHV